MGIGTSDGKYFDEETDYVFDQFSKGQQSNFETKLSKEEESKYQDWKSTYAPNDSGFDYDLRGAFKSGLEPDPTTGHWLDTYKKPNHETFSDQSIYAKDAPHLAGTWDGDTYIPPSNVDIGTAAPNFSGPSSLMDMMDKAGEIQKRRFGPTASAAQAGESDFNTVAARPRDPSVDSFIDRYGVWNIDDSVKKIIEDYRIDNEMTPEGKIKTLNPGTRTWPHGNVISDEQPYPIEDMQQYAMMKMKDVPSNPGVEAEKLAGATAVARGGTGTVKLQRTMEADSFGTYKYSIQNNEGKHLASATLSAYNDGRDLYVNSVGGIGGAGSIGPKAMRDVIKQLKTEFPDAERLFGLRVSGVRGKQGSAAEGGVNLKPRSEWKDPNQEGIPKNPGTGSPSNINNMSDAEFDAMIRNIERLAPRNRSPEMQSPRTNEEWDRAFRTIEEALRNVQ